MSKYDFSKRPNNHRESYGENPPDNVIAKAAVPGFDPDPPAVAPKPERVAPPITAAVEDPDIVKILTDKATQFLHATLSDKSPEVVAVDFQPMYDRVLVRELKRDEQVAGVYIPDSMKDTMKRGTVIATGDGHPSTTGFVRPLHVQIGDTVLFGIYAGLPILLNDDELIVLREGEIFGRVYKRE